MSETGHETFIKTPRQLVAVVALSFVVPVLLIVFLTQLITGSLRIRDANFSADAVRERIKPVAQVYLGSAPPPPAIPAAPAASTASAGAPDGQAVFNQICTVCHTAGLNGAPKVGDKAAWAPRLAQGVAALHASAIKGKNAMPAKGGNPALSDAEVSAAVDYMVGASK